MQGNEEDSSVVSHFNSEQASSSNNKPSNNLIEISQLTRSRRVFVYWPNEELKSQFIRALAKETTVRFDEYNHLDENEQCTMPKFRTGGVESQKLCDFMKKNPQFKEFQLYASKQTKFSFERSFSQSSSSSCSSSMNSSKSFSFPPVVAMLNEKILNDSADDSLYTELSTKLSPKQSSDISSEAVTDNQYYKDKDGEELFLELSGLLLTNLAWGMSDLYNYAMTSNDIKKKVALALVFNSKGSLLEQIANSRQYATRPVNTQSASTSTSTTPIPSSQPYQFSFIRNQELLVQAVESNQIVVVAVVVVESNKVMGDDINNIEGREKAIKDTILNLSNEQLVCKESVEKGSQQEAEEVLADISSAKPTNSCSEYAKKSEENHYARHNKARDNNKKNNKSPFINITSRSPSPINRKQPQQPQN